jgi:hypothetical protein
MKRTASIIAAALMMVGASTGAASAANPNPSGDYYAPAAAGVCGQMHGAFNVFGPDNNMAGGANGPVTGEGNSAKFCQSHFL